MIKLIALLKNNKYNIKFLFLNNYLIFMFIILTIIALFLFNVFVPNENKNIISFTSGFTFLTSVIVYIISLEILKNALIHWKDKQKVNFDQDKYSHAEIKILSILSAFPFGLGVTSFLKGISVKKIDTLPISQGMALSIILYPTTPASGYILDFYNISSMSSIFLFGIPIALIMIFSFNGYSLKYLFKTKFIVFIIIMGIVNFIYIWLFSFLIEGHFLLKESFFYLILSFYIYKNILNSLLKIILNTKGEILFFMGVGVLGNTIILILEHTQFSFDRFMFSSNFALLIPIFILPILSIFFIPPFVLFIVFTPFLTPLLEFNGFSEIAIYTIWMLMLINSQLLSPVSLTTILAAKNSGYTIFEESFLKHHNFCIKISIFSIIYLITMKAI